MNINKFFLLNKLKYYKYNIAYKVNAQSLINKPRDPWKIMVRYLSKSKEDMKTEESNKKIKLKKLDHKDNKDKYHRENEKVEKVIDFENSKAGKNAMYATKLGAVANLGLAISKGSLGFTISSTGLIADAANSLGL